MPAIASVAYAFLILAIALSGAIALSFLTNRGAKSGHWLLVVVGAGIVAFITLGVMTEVSAVLEAMHPLGRSGGGIMDIVGNPDRARGVVDAWQTWFTQPYASASARPPISPRTVSLWYLGLDSLAFLPAYALFFGVLFRRARAALTDEADKRERIESQPSGAIGQRPKADEALTSATLTRFADTGLLAVGVFALVPFFDLLENGMLWRFVERRIQVCATGECSGVDTPGDAFVFLLRAISYLKLGAFFLSLLVALLPLAVWARLGTEWFRSVRPAVRRLRGQIVYSRPVLRPDAVQPSDQGPLPGVGLPARPPRSHRGVPRRRRDLEHRTARDLRPARSGRRGQRPCETEAGTHLRFDDRFRWRARSDRRPRDLVRSRPSRSRDPRRLPACARAVRIRRTERRCDGPSGGSRRDPRPGSRRPRHRVADPARVLRRESALPVADVRPRRVVHVRPSSSTCCGRS